MVKCFNRMSNLMTLCRRNGATKVPLPKAAHERHFKRKTCCNIEKVLLLVHRLMLQAENRNQ